MQSWELFPAYIPDGVWASFQKSELNMMAALELILTTLVKMGMRTPSEPTQAMLVSLLILRKGPERRSRLEQDTNQLRSLLCTFA